MYHIHTTEGIILKRFKEDYNASFLIFTKDFGLIRAKAQGVRKVESKLKPALQEYCLSEISFVKGKTGFRIVGAQSLYSFFDSQFLESSQTIALICNTILRFVHYEEKNSEIYGILEKGFKELKKNINVDIIEILILILVMNSLGYISKDELGLNLSTVSLSNIEVINKIKENKNKITGLINKAFKESHL